MFEGKLVLVRRSRTFFLLGDTGWIGRHVELVFTISCCFDKDLVEE